MNRVLLLLAFAFTVLPLHLAHGLEAGAAKTEITPPIGTPMNGYGARMGRSSTGIHDPLWSRCLFLDDGETQVLLVNTDLCMINAELRARVLELAPEGVPKEHIILTATHTHSAQGGMHRYLPLRFVAGRYMEDVVEHTASRIAESMRLAIETKQRAALGYGTAKQKVLSVNRRETGGPIDEQIGVIRVDDADGNIISIVTNFSAHPTSVGGASQYEFSADFVGFYYDEVERLSSEGCVALFLNGTEGNQTINDPEGNSGWERTASVGRLLAVRAKSIANEIDCTEVKLGVQYSEPTLPRSIASGFMPESTVLQTLEINDELLLTFWPGEPVVELGLEMRRRALAAGYRAAFNVGLANDYLMYFVPRSLYHNFYYESAQNYYGPDIADWFYAQFDQMMSRTAAPPASPAGGIAERRTVDGVTMLVLEGDAFARGQARGEYFAEEIHALYQERIAEPIHSGAALPQSGMWGMIPGFMDMATLALPMMSIAARPLLTGISEDAYREMEGMAEGAGIPFDALWLLQNARRFDNIENRDSLFTTPLCTMFAVTGERVGLEGILVGRNLDWTLEEKPLITEVRPETGHAFIQVGFAWNAGVFTGMNYAGLVVAVERLEDAPPETISGAAIEFVLRDLLQNHGDVENAAATLRAYNHFDGYQVLLVGEGEDGFDARVIAWHDKNQTETGAPESGVFLPASEETMLSGNNGGIRYNRVAELSGLRSSLDVEAIQEILQDTEPGREGLAQIWNADTQHSVVFAPRTRTMYVAFSGEDGKAGRYTRLSLRGVATDE